MKRSRFIEEQMLAIQRGLAAMRRRFEPAAERDQGDDGRAPPPPWDQPDDVVLRLAEEVRWDGPSDAKRLQVLEDVDAGKNRLVADQAPTSGD